VARGSGVTLLAGRRGAVVDGDVSSTERQMKQVGGGLVSKIDAWLNEEALGAFYRAGEAVEREGEVKARPAAINGVVSMET
jgi:hypothetical protein